MNIGIDCRFWGLRHAGLGRYTRNLVLEILKLNECHSRLSNTKYLTNRESINFILFVQAKDWQETDTIFNNCKIIKVDIPHYSLKEQILLPRIIDSQNLDLIHYPHFNIPVLAKTTFVVTIHDLIKHFFKGKPVTTRSFPVYWAKYLGYRLVINKAIENSQKIITPSIFTQDQILSEYSINSSKIKVIYEAVEEDFKNLNTSSSYQEKLLQKLKINSPFFIYTGSAYPSKNLETLLSAFKKLVSFRAKPRNLTNSPILIISCTRNQFWQKIQNLIKKENLEKHVLLPGKLSDKDLKALYGKAQAFIIPSLMEGFGLPALEAMSAGCPIISSETGSLPEIYGNVPFYFHPQKPEELVEKMQQISNLTSEKRQDLIQKGINKANEYSWVTAAQETFKIYKNLLSSKL